MKYLKDLLKIIFFVLIIYVPFIFWGIFDDLNNIENSFNAETVKKVSRLKEAVNLLLSEGRVLEACQRLNAERSAESIFLYVMSSPDMSCQDPVELSQKISAPSINKISQMESEDGRNFIIYSNEVNSAQWTVMANLVKVRLVGGTVTNQQSIILNSLLKNLALVLYIVFAFAFLAVLILTKSIQIQYRKKGRDPVWLRVINRLFGWLQLHDLKIVQSATAALIRKNESLVRDQDLLETSLEYSILNEIRENNHNIPYSFRGTVAKVDINGFSKIVSAGNKEMSQSMTKTLEDYGCELLLRYQGLFEKTVGDEIVVVFKRFDSALLAAAFSRDLMAGFSTLEFDFGSEKRTFTLKSSISSSELIFSKRAPGYGFFGDALTYTTRLLDVVDIKDRNILSCFKDQVGEIQDLVTVPREMRKFEFKNMSSSEGYLLESFTQVEDVYFSRPELIKYFRSDAAFAFLLKRVQTETDQQRLDMIFACFQDSTVRLISESIISVWIETLKAFEKRAAQDPKLIFSFSKLIIEGSRLIPTPQWNPACSEAIISISRHIEGRINASIVDVLIEKDMHQIAIEQEKSFLIESDQSFRTRGNLLINQAMYELSDSVLDKVIRMIHSKQALESSTGIFCACSIIIYYRKKNPAELETFMSYRNLLKILKDLSLGANKEISPRLLSLLEQVNQYNELTYSEVSP